MKEFIYNEMMVHVPVCTSKDPKNVLIISDNANGLENEMQKHDLAYRSFVLINFLKKQMQEE